MFCHFLLKKTCWHAVAQLTQQTSNYCKIISNIWTQKPRKRLKQALFQVGMLSMVLNYFSHKYPTSLFWDAQSGFGVSHFEDPHLLYFSSPWQKCTSIICIRSIFYPTPSPLAAWACLSSALTRAEETFPICFRWWLACSKGFTVPIKRPKDS